MNERRVRAALRLAGVDDADTAKLEIVTPSVYRARGDSEVLACKLFEEPQARDRARVEGNAYAVLSAKGAPVPRLVAVDESRCALVREWINGPTLSQALRDGGALPNWSTVATAWDALIDALDPWTESLEPARVERAQALRASEVQALAEAITASAMLSAELPNWNAVQADMGELADAVSSADVRTVPLDLSSGNIVLGPEGPMFIDLDGFGLDFAEWSLCKATMLPCDLSSGRGGQALLSAVEAQAGRLAQAGALLLALVDASGLWRSASGGSVCLELAREVARSAAVCFPRLAAALV